MSKLIAQVATAVLINGNRVIIQPGQELPELSQHDAHALLDSGAAQSPAIEAAKGRWLEREATEAEREFEEARRRALEEQASTRATTEASTDTAGTSTGTEGTGTEVKGALPDVAGLDSAFAGVGLSTLPDQEAAHAATTAAAETVAKVAAPKAATSKARK